MSPKRENLSEEKQYILFIIHQLGDDVVEQMEEHQLLKIINLKISLNDIRIALDAMETTLPAEEFKDVKQLLSQAIHYLQMEPARKPPNVFYKKYCDDVPKHLANARQKLLLAEAKISNGELKEQVAEFREHIGDVINDIPGAIAAAPITPSSAGIMIAMGAAAAPTVDAKKAAQVNPGKPPLVPAPIKPFEINATSIGEMINYIGDFQAKIREIISAIKADQPDLAELLKKINETLNKSHLRIHNDPAVNTISGQFINLRSAVALIEGIKNHKQHEQLAIPVQKQIDELQAAIEKIILREHIEILNLIAKGIVNNVINASNPTEEAKVKRILFDYADKMLKHYNELNRSAIDKSVLTACTGVLRSIKH